MPDTKSRKRAARERVAAMRAQQRRAQRRRNLVTAAAVTAVVVAAVAVIAWYLAARGSAGQIAGVRTYTGLSRNHVQGKVSYPQTPPVGGQHNPAPLNCGIYTSPVPNENAVHSMEHGAVWITYRPGLPASGVTQLQNLVRGEPQATRGYIELSPYPGLPSPVVASAWGKQLRLTSPSDTRLGRFVTTYAQGPQTPERGAACSGGVGTPSG